MTVQIPAHALPAMWPTLAPYVARALEYGSREYTPHDVLAACLEGRWQMWSDGRSLACTSIVQYPAARMLYVHVGAGELKSALDMWPALQKFAISHACDSVQFMGRPGWRKCGVLPSGWRHTHDVVTVAV